VNRYLILCWAGLFSSHVMAESLSEVYASALQNDYKLKAAEFAYLAELEGRNIARSGLLPRVSVEGSLSRSETTTEVESSNPLFIKRTNIQNNTDSGYNISLTQPIIDIAALKNYKRSEISSRIASVRLAQEKTSLIYRTADAYLKALKAGAQLEAAQSAQEAFHLQLSAANIKYDVGLAKVSDVHEAQARYDSAFADGIVAKNNLNASFDSLSVITGKEYTELATFPESFVASLPTPQEYAPWAEATRKNNFEINLSQLHVTEAHKNYQARKSEHLPRLTGNVNYSDGYNDRKYNNALPDRWHNEGVSASLILTVPLYSGGAVSASAREANYHYFELLDYSNNINREIMSTSHSVYLSVVSGVAAVNARKTAIKSSQSALTYAQKGYEQGIRNVIDVLDAQSILYQARQNYSDALYEYLIAGLRLKEIAGLLSSDDIAELSSNLDAHRKIYQPSLH
jgi:outer membrane protein